MHLVYEFAPSDSPLTLTPPGTVIWAGRPAPEALAWWLGADEPRQGNWTNFDGYAVATYYQSPAGGRVVQLPNARPLNNVVRFHPYDKIFLNLLTELSQRA